MPVDDDSPTDLDPTDIDLTDLDPTDIDLTDLDRFVDGFPHEVFAFLRREAPVWFHPPTVHTPGGEGFWVVSTHADCLAAAADAVTFSSDTGPAGTAPGAPSSRTCPAGSRPACC